MLTGTAALANSSLPTVLVATKCDTPDTLRHPDLAGLASAFATCVGHFRTASNAPASARECLQAMLRVALANRRGEVPLSLTAQTIPPLHFLSSLYFRRFEAVLNAFYRKLFAGIHANAGGD